MDSSKLKTSQGSPRGADSLIISSYNSDGAYTLEELYNLYMASEDLTEWEFANKHLLGWSHWELLQTNKRFLKEVESWRRDLEQKIKSRAFRQIMLEAEEGGKNAFEANKILLNGRWKEIVKEVGLKRGRPSKHEVDQRTQEELDKGQLLLEDFKRLGLEVN